MKYPQLYICISEPLPSVWPKLIWTFVCWLVICCPTQPSTLPQGTVNMNLCTDVIDAEARTGQKNALCIITPEQEYYIRGDNKEIINGYVACSGRQSLHRWDTKWAWPLLSFTRWSEQLVVYPRTNKQNQKKKRKVEPATTQVLYDWNLCSEISFICTKFHFMCSQIQTEFLFSQILQFQFLSFWIVVLLHFNNQKGCLISRIHIFFYLCLCFII